MTDAQWKKHAERWMKDEDLFFLRSERLGKHELWQVVRSMKTFGYSDDEIKSWAWKCIRQWRWEEKEMVIEALGSVANAKETIKGLVERYGGGEL